MSLSNNECAESLIVNQKAIADAASLHLLQHKPEMTNWFGKNSQEHWIEHFLDRVMELSESVAAGEPQIFSNHISWAKQAIASRNLDNDYLSATLESLRAGIQTALSPETVNPVINCFDKALDLNGSVEQAVWDSALDPRNTCDSVALDYIQAVISGNIWLGMQIVLDAVDEGLSIKDVFLRVLLPAQTEVGRLWHLNEVSVAEEHLLTSTTQRLMSVLAHRALRKPDRGHTVIAASVAGNAHDMGIRTIAYLMEFEGWRTIFLGADMPRSELPAAIKFYSADVVLLSIALSTQLRTLKRTVNEIREICGSDVKIMLGGQGLNNVPNLWKEIGGDGYSKSIEDAIEIADELVTTS
ncbi:MAG: cobalamin B12-binding domain-containing protein [Rhodospirillales bacterium]|jgi:methanogenic corrinoid protein MtbC1